MKSFLVFILLNTIFANAQNISSKEIFEQIKNYPQNNYIGTYGSSDMKPMHNGAYRDFGRYKKAKIKITPEKLQDQKINVSGTLFIFDQLKEKFNGVITITKIDSFYKNNNDLDSKGNMIYDSILTNTVKGDFSFTLKNKTIYEGRISIHLEKLNKNEWIINRSGIALFGTYNNKTLDYGNITPPSSGIFRVNPKEYSKFCINKGLMKLGWETYMLSKPEYFNCTFDSFSDEIEYLIEDKNQTEIYIQIENNEIK